MSVLIRTLRWRGLRAPLGRAGLRRRRRLRRDERHRRQGAGLFRLRARPPRLAGVRRAGGPAPEDGRAGGAQDQRARALPQPHQQGRHARRRRSLLREDRLQADRRAAPPGPGQATCTSRPTARCSGCRTGECLPHASRASAARSGALQIRTSTPAFDGPDQRRTVSLRYAAAASGTRWRRLLRCRVSSAPPTPSPPTPSCSTARSCIYDAAPAQALAVRDGKIAAIGSTADIRALAGADTRVIDLGGRTVIPGLIDSHIHAIRAGPDLHHRGALDRRAHARRGARPHPRRGRSRAEGIAG